VTSKITQNRIGTRGARIPNRVAIINRRMIHSTLDMAKFDGIKGQELLDVEVGDNDITLIFKDNRFLFVRIENGRFVCESVPE
jgi:propanediol utilization protein